MLAFSTISIDDLQQKFGLTVENEAFLPVLQPLPLPAWLETYLSINRLSPALAKSEKAVSEMLIAPVLSAVKANNANKISLFSGEPLSDGQFYGTCDFIIASNPKAYLPEPPLMVLVEAKKQDIYPGISQCIAEMVAAQNINRRLNITTDIVFGCVTTGTEWMFIQLTGKKAITDPVMCYFNDLPKIMSIFQWMVNTFFEQDTLQQLLSAA